MTGYLLTSRVEGPALLAMSMHEAQWYFIFWRGDIQARSDIGILCKGLLREGNMEGAGILWDALLYLTDRATYQAAIERRGVPNGRCVAEPNDSGNGNA